jgi:hypothetical protein
VSGIECEEHHACDIEKIRVNSRSNLMGGWYKVSVDDSKVKQLYRHASSIARVQTEGPIIEAYAQTVAGFNYCILFGSTAGINCGNNCEKLACVAGAHQPLPQTTSNADTLTAIGVRCQKAIPGAPLLGYSHMNGLAPARLSSLVAMTLTVASVVVICLH